jgi:phosphonate transport system substrate-binding protein
MNIQKSHRILIDRIWRIFILVAFLINPLALSGNTAYAQSDSNGLISYWSFNEGSGDFVGDTSAANNGNTGTLVNSPQWVSSPFGSALSFDANADQYVSTLNNNDSLSIPSGGITITAWINAADVSGVRNILAKDKEETTSRGNYSLAIVDGKLRFGFSQESDYGDNWIDTQTGISPNRWYFVAVTHTYGNSGATAIYINGVSQTLSEWQCDWGCDPDSAPATFLDPLYIGRSICNGEPFHGLIDEVRVYDRVLSPAEFEYTPLPVGSTDNPVRLYFYPSIDEQVLLDGGQVMADYLYQETGLNFEVVIPNSFSETVYEVCQNPDTSIGFMPSFGYVLGSDYCGLQASLKAVRFGWDGYWGEILVPRNSGIQTVSELNEKVWGIPDYMSASGYMAPMVMLNNANATPADVIEAGSHPQAVMALYNGDVDFVTTFFSPPLTDPAWQPGDEPDIPTELVDSCETTPDGTELLCGDWRVMDGRSLIRNDVPDVVQAIRILEISEKIPHDGIAFGPDFPSVSRAQIETALLSFAETGDWWNSVGSGDSYGWEGITSAVDAEYGFAREMVAVAGLTLENWDSPPEYNPNFATWDWHTVHGYNWLLDDLITLTVDDDNDPGNGVLYTATDTSHPASWDPSVVGVEYEVPFTLLPGYVMSMSDGVITKTMTVVDIQITNVDENSDTVSGIAPAGWDVNIDIHDGGGRRRTVADGNGNWTADFANPGAEGDEQDIVDLVPGISGNAYTPDDDGDSTGVNWKVAYPPAFAVWLDDSRQTLDARGFLPNATLTISIDDLDTSENPDYTSIETLGEDGSLSVELSYDVQPDDIVTISDGVTTKIHRIRYLVVNAIDVDMDTISGSTEPSLGLIVRAPNDDVSINVTSDENGAWTADFSGVLDLTPGMGGFVELGYDDGYGDNILGDEDGDNTIRGWQIPRPEVWAHPNDSSEDWIDVRDWAFGDTVYLTIDDDTDPLNGVLYSDSGEVGPANWNPSVGVKEFHLGSFDLQPGHFVTVTGTTTTKELLITDLNVTEINADLNTVSGIAVAGTAVQAWLHEEHSCNSEIIADQNGNWTADFNPCDLAPSVGGGVGQMDVDGDSTVYFWWVPNLPNIGVRPAEDRIEGWEWELGAIVDIEIDDPGTPASPDHVDSVEVVQADWDPSQTTWDLQLRDIYDIKPGDVVTASDGNVTKVHTVTSLTMDHADVDTDTVTGSAEPGSRVDIWICDDQGCANRHVDADGGGQWSADFATPGVEDDEQDTRDIAPGTWIDSSQNDEDGDSTMAGINIKNPTFGVRANHDNIEGWEWDDGAVITLEIDDPATPENPDYTDTTTVGYADWDPNQTWFMFETGGVYDIKVGDLVTVSDGEITKEHAVLNLAFTDFDTDADVVFGIGVPDSQINVWTCDDFGCINREELTDGAGNWSVDFSVPGDQNWEQEIADLRGGSWVDSSQNDEDGDQTMFGINIPNYNITAFPVDDAVEAWEWPEGNTVYLTIDDPNTQESPDFEREGIAEVTWWGDSRTYVRFDFYDEYDLKAGDLVTVTDGNILRSHVVLELALTNVDPATDTITGTAVPGSMVVVWPHEYDQDATLEVETDQDSVWEADFTGLFDLASGMGGRSQIEDEAGNATAVDWNALSYTLHAVPSYPEVHGHDWEPGSDVTLIIDDDLDPNNGILYEDTRNMDDDPWCGNPCFDLSGIFDLQIGHYVTMTDGMVSKTVLVSQLTVNEVNYENDTVSGIADPGSRVAVNIWSQEGNARYVTADGAGLWVADYSQVGDEDFEQELADIQEGDWGRAIQLNPDGSDDGTLEYWGEGPSIWEAPDEVPLVAAISNSPDLNRLGFDYESWSIANLLWEPLFRTTDQGDLMPAAAYDYSVSPDGLVYTITLRDDALWSDGTPVEAQHFVDGFLRLISPDTATDYGYLLYEIEGSEAYGLGETSDTSTVGLLALNNQTLQITLHRPAAYFIKVLANPGMIPARADLLDLYGDAWVEPGNFVGNGPYMLVEYDDSHLLVEKNQNFHDADQLIFNQIGLAVISDEGQRLDAYREGLVDLILNVSTDSAKEPDLASDRYPRALGIYFVGLNTEKPPLDNPLVRKALASAIDRNHLFEDIFETSWTQSATGVIPPDIPGYQGDSVGYTFDAVQAQTYLSDAGYPGGAGFPEIVLYVDGGQSISMEYVAEQWRTVLGIPVRIEYTDSNDYIAHLHSCHENPASCNYHAYRLGWFVDYYDAYSILGDVFHPDANFSLWESTPYRDLIDLSLSELDPAQRITYLQQAEQVLVEDETAAIPIGFADQISLTKQAFEPAFGLVPYLDLWSYAPPTIGVYAADESMPSNEVVEIYNWAGDEVSIIIDDPATPEIGDYFETRTSVPLPEFFSGMYPDVGTIARFELAGSVDIEPGFTISVEGVPEATYTVSDLSITNVGLGLDTVSGTSAPNEQIDLNVCNNYDLSDCVGFSVVADGGGFWQADFGAWGFDLQVGSEGSARQRDEDGNQTIVDFSILTSPDAGFVPTTDVVVQPGETINLAAAVNLTGPVTFIGEDAIRALQMAIEDHGPVEGFDVQFTEFDSACDFASGEQAALQVIQEPSIVGVIGHVCSSSVKGGAPIYEEAGLVMLSGSATMHTVPAYGPTIFNRTVFSDFDHDSAYWLDELRGQQSVQAWNYDFKARFGVEPRDFAILYYDAARLLLERIEETAVLQGGELLINRAALAAAVRDTALRQSDSGCWSLGHNGSRQECGGGLVNISYTEKLIWAPFWDIGDELTLQIYDQNDNLIYNPEPQVVDQAWFATDFDFPHAIFYYGDEFDMQPGYRVVVSNGEITKETVATELGLGTLDPVSDQVSGTALPGSHVFVEAWQFGIRRHTLADGTGNWFVDFATPGDEEFEGDVLDIEAITALDVAQFTGENKTYVAAPIGEIRGTVLLDGQPLSDVEVWVNGPIFNGERYHWHVCTDLNGEFVVQKVPPGPVDGFISATGPSVAIGCANAEFLDENGVPLMVQFWDHVDGIPEATFFDFDPLAQPHGNPYIELQYDIMRATAIHDVYTTVHIVDQAGAGACPQGEAECDLALNDVEIDAYAGSEWVYRWYSGQDPFGEGNSQFRYKTVSDLTLNATYLDLDSGQELVATLPVGAAEFVDRGDGVFVAPTLTFNFIKVIAPDGSISLYFDTDGDHIADGDDNAPEDYNPDQRDVDGDGVADVLDPCPDDDTDICDPGASGASVVGSDGGTVETLDGNASLDISDNALSDEISFSITDSGAGYEVTNFEGELFVIQSCSIQPEGTIFDPPALLTLRWDDADDDGIIDGTAYEEANLLLIKDGVIMTPSCVVNPSCDMVANLLTIEISSLSLFELAFFTNSPPIADAGADQIVNEGEIFTLSAVGSSDPDNDELTYNWDLDNDGEYDDAVGLTVDRSFAENGLYTVGLQVTDTGDLSDTDTVEIEVLNVAPQITEILAPIDPVQVDEAVDVSAFFTDPGGEDTHTALWDWGDGTSSAGAVNGYYLTGAHQYTVPGVYTLTLTVTDNDDGVATEYYQYVVVFDPEGGFVTGGGWFTDPETSDKANFGFNAKYHMDAKIPFGNLNFKVNDLRFESTAYDWLVVSGERAQFQGTGMVNDASGYSFFVTVIDGKISGDGDDYFRIKIWDTSTGVTVYDNHPTLPDDADPSVAIKGGSIVIHK